MAEEEGTVLGVAGEGGSTIVDCGSAGGGRGRYPAEGVRSSSADFAASTVVDKGSVSCMSSSPDRGRYCPPEIVSFLENRLSSSEDFDRRDSLLLVVAADAVL